MSFNWDGRSLLLVTCMWAWGPQLCSQCSPKAAHWHARSTQCPPPPLCCVWEWGLQSGLATVRLLPPSWVVKHSEGVPRGCRFQVACSDSGVGGLWEVAGGWGFACWGQEVGLLGALWLCSFWWLQCSSSCPGLFQVCVLGSCCMGCLVCGFCF